jgi:hypothetical protein
MVAGWFIGNSATMLAAWILFRERKPSTYAETFGPAALKRARRGPEINENDWRALESAAKQWEQEGKP